MQHQRRTLSLRIPSDTDPTAAVADLLRRAIARKLCVAAVYNRTAVELAPHVVYARHGDLFVDGVVLLRDGKPPRELKLGTFKLAGLSGTSLTPRPFTIHPEFDPADPKYSADPEPAADA